MMISSREYIEIKTLGSNASQRLSLSDCSFMFNVILGAGGGVGRGVGGGGGGGFGGGGADGADVGSAGRDAGGAVEPGHGVHGGEHPRWPGRRRQGGRGRLRGL